MTKDYYSVQEVAEIESLSEKTVLRKIRDGRILGAYREGNSIRIPKESYNDYVRGEETHRRFISERNILRGASSTISVLGINSLGILHQNREMLISKLNEGVKVRFLLLDPDSEMFKERAYVEENVDGNTSGRLRAESLASYAICKDIFNFVRSPKQKENFSLRYFSSKPTMALIITDHERSSGYCSLNHYPSEKVPGTDPHTGEETEIDSPIQNVRGLCGEYEFFPNYNKERILFQRYLQRYNTKWDKAVPIDLSKDID